MVGSDLELFLQFVFRDPREGLHARFILRGKRTEVVFFWFGLVEISRLKIEEGVVGENDVGLVEREFSLDRVETGLSLNIALRRVPTTRNICFN